MVTKEQAVAAGATFGAVEFHYVGRSDCKRNVGPRGGITVNVVVARTSGRCQTWKTRPEEFRLPVKHGLYESGEITNRNAADWHLASDCPINAAQS